MGRARPESRSGSAARNLLRSWAASTLTLLACAAVWAALVFPNSPSGVRVSTFARIPVEGLVVLALALVLPRRSRRFVGVVFGVLLAALMVVKVLDLGFYTILERRFDLVNDWPYLRSGLGVLRDTHGLGGAIVAVVVAVLLGLLLFGVLPVASARMTRAAAGHRGRWGAGLVVLGTAWVVLALVGMGHPGVGHVASAGATQLVSAEVDHLHADIVDHGVFAKQIAQDRYADVPAGRLLGRLRGKDVLLVFVESYGRVALEHPELSRRVDPVLDAGTRRLRRAGYHSRSAFLTSPTFGAGSWLAHATMQSGLWVNSQQRYDQLLSTHRLTLTRMFSEAGWHTVFDQPADTQGWAQGKAFYDFDRLYDAHDVGYRGPSFGFATMPDQYTLRFFRRHVLAPTHRRPVMAEIDLVSSHHPWAPLPHLIDWDSVGDGTVYGPMVANGDSPAQVFENPDDVRVHYARSIVYTMRTLVSFLATSHDPNLVLVVLGDHQPHTYVTGPHPGHDVPVSVIARDPSMVRAISRWHWQPGLHPSRDAPVWRMSAFRDEFVAAFSGPTASPRP